MFFFCTSKLCYNVNGDSMQKKVKILIACLILLVISVLGYFYFSNKFNKIEEHTKSIFYMDTYIYIKLYGLDKDEATKVFNEVENIYKDYHQLTDRYHPYDNIKNIYYILHNQDDSEYITLDKKLYDLIEYGLSWYQKSNEALDIRMGNVIDIWKNYRDNNYGIPTTEELQLAAFNAVYDVELGSNNQIKNNHPNLDLGAVAKGYTTEKVGEYLESVGVDTYLINAGGNVKVGKHYDKGFYTIGIENPDSTTGDIYKIVSGNNISVVTSGGYERYYEYNGELFHHIIDSKTLYPTNYMKSVTIITEDSALGDVLSTTLFLMTIEEGQAYIKNFDGVDVIWYTNNNEEIMTDGMSKYEY